MSHSHGTWSAQFEDNCAECGNPIRSGEEIGEVDSNITCLGCWIDAGGSDEPDDVDYEE